jgi:DNA primase
MIALSLDMQVKIAVLPEGKDPADIIMDNIDAWKEIIKTSVNIVSFHIDRICKSTNDTRIRGKQIRDVVFPFLTMVLSSIERSAYISEISRKTGLPESSIIEDFEKYEKTQGLTRDKKEVDEIKENIATSRRNILEKKFTSILFWGEQTEDTPKELDDLVNLFKEKIGLETFEKIKKQYEPWKDTLVIEAEMWYGSKIDTTLRDLKEIILNLEEEILQERKTLLLPLDTDEKIRELGSISKRIEEIKSERSLI